MQIIINCLDILFFFSFFCYKIKSRLLFEYLKWSRAQFCRVSSAENLFTKKKKKILPNSENSPLGACRIRYSYKITAAAIVFKELTRTKRGNIDWWRCSFSVLIWKRENVITKIIKTGLSPCNNYYIRIHRVQVKSPPRVLTLCFHFIRRRAKPHIFPPRGTDNGQSKITTVRHSIQRLASGGKPIRNYRPLHVSSERADMK